MAIQLHFVRSLCRLFMQYKGWRLEEKWSVVTREVRIVTISKQNKSNSLESFRVINSLVLIVYYILAHFCATSKCDVPRHKKCNLLPSISVFLSFRSFLFSSPFFLMLSISSAGCNFLECELNYRFLISSKLEASRPMVNTMDILSQMTKQINTQQPFGLRTKKRDFRVHKWGEF